MGRGAGRVYERGAGGAGRGGAGRGGAGRVWVVFRARVAGRGACFCSALPPCALSLSIYLSHSPDCLSRRRPTRQQSCRPQQHARRLREDGPAGGGGKRWRWQRGLARGGAPIAGRGRGRSRRARLRAGCEGGHSGGVERAVEGLCAMHASARLSLAEHRRVGARGGKKRTSGGRPALSRRRSPRSPLAKTRRRRAPRRPSLPFLYLAAPCAPNQRPPACAACPRPPHLPAGGAAVAAALAFGALEWAGQQRRRRPSARCSGAPTRPRGGRPAPRWHPQEGSTPSSWSQSGGLPRRVPGAPPWSGPHPPRSPTHPHHRPLLWPARATRPPRAPPPSSGRTSSCPSSG